MRRQWSKLVLLVSTVVLAAVAPSPASAAPSARPSTAAATAAGTAGGEGAGIFPVDVNGVDGTPLVAARPTRILSLSPSATQMLYDIGAGSQVVGVDKYSTYPANAPRTKFTGNESSAEDYLYLSPDLVIFAFKTNLVSELKDLRHPGTGATSRHDDRRRLHAQMAELGAATGHGRAAKRASSSVAAAIASAVRAAKGAGRGDTYYIELDPRYYYTATSKTFIGAEFSLFGMRDIADAAGHGTAYPAISAEYLLKENPDYVFLADTVCCHETASTFGHRPGFATLTAVKLHHVVPVNDSVASQWGPQPSSSLLACWPGPCDHDAHGRPGNGHRENGRPFRDSRTSGTRAPPHPAPRRPSGPGRRLSYRCCHRQCPGRPGRPVAGRRAGRDRRQGPAPAHPFGPGRHRQRRGLAVAHAPDGPGRAGRGDARRWRALRTRVCSTTLWPTPTCSGWPPAPVWAPPSPSCTARLGSFRPVDPLPLAAFVGAVVAVAATFALGRSNGAGATIATPRAGGRGRRRVLHRCPDLHPASRTRRSWLWSTPGSSEACRRRGGDRSSSILPYVAIAAPCCSPAAGC